MNYLEAVPNPLEGQLAQFMGGAFDASAFLDWVGDLRLHPIIGRLVDKETLEKMGASEDKEKG